MNLILLGNLSAFKCQQLKTRKSGEHESPSPQIHLLFASLENITSSMVWSQDRFSAKVNQLSICYISGRTQFTPAQDHTCWDWWQKGIHDGEQSCPWGRSLHPSTGYSYWRIFPRCGSHWASFYSSSASPSQRNNKPYHSHSHKTAQGLPNSHRFKISQKRAVPEHNIK